MFSLSGPPFSSQLTLKLTHFTLFLSCNPPTHTPMRFQRVSSPCTRFVLHLRHASVSEGILSIMLSDICISLKPSHFYCDLKQNHQHGVNSG